MTNIVVKFSKKTLNNKQKLFRACKYIQKLSASLKVVVVVPSLGNTASNLFGMVNSYKNLNLRELDALISTAETKSASLFAIMLNNIGVKAVSLQAWQIDLKVMGAYGKSIVTSVNKNKITKVLKDYDCVVVGATQGVNENSETSLINYSESDSIAVAIGTVLDCEIEII